MSAPLRKSDIKKHLIPTNKIQITMKTQGFEVNEEFESMLPKVESETPQPEKTIVLTRTGFYTDRTIGKLEWNGKLLACTLEPEVNNFSRGIGTHKEDNKAIPIGEYKFTVRNKYRIDIHNVPQYTGIQIHTGNRRDQTKGCILVGDGTTEDKKNGIILTSSRKAMKTLQEKIYNESIYKITIKELETCNSDANAKNL